MLVLYIAIAGALGALARWGLVMLLGRVAEPSFPWGTLAVNLLGCLLIGMLMEAVERSHFIDHEIQVVIAVGFIGTFTTFSTFAYESLQIARSGAWLRMSLNLTLNVVLGFFLVWLGSLVVRQAFPRRPAVASARYEQSTIEK